MKYKNIFIAYLKLVMNFKINFFYIKFDETLIKKRERF